MTQNQVGVAPSEASPAVSPTQQNENTRAADPAARGFRHLGPHIGFLLALLLLAANMRGSIVAMGRLPRLSVLICSFRACSLGC